MKKIILCALLCAVILASCIADGTSTDGSYADDGTSYGTTNGTADTDGSDSADGVTDGTDGSTRTADTDGSDTDGTDGTADGGTALANSTALSAFPRDGATGEYLLTDHARLQKDGTVRLSPDGGDLSAPFYAAAKVVARLWREYGVFAEGVTFAFGDEGVMEVEIVTDTSLDSTPTELYIKSVTSHGHTLTQVKNYRSAYTYRGDYDHYSFYSFPYDPHAFLLISSSPSNATQYVYAFTDSGIVEIANDVWSDENASLLYFSQGDGRIDYTRRPVKYSPGNLQWIGGLLSKCASRDELAAEQGKASFKGGSLRLIPEKTVSVDELFCLDDHYAEFKAAARRDEYYPPKYNEEYGCYFWNSIPLFETVDEFLEYNKEFATPAQ